MPASRGSLLVPAVLAATLAASASIGEAGPVHYVEIIEDLNDFPFVGFDLSRDLVRARLLGTGDLLVETDDGAIDAENQVSPSFGLTVTEAITYSHVFIGVPPVQTFQTLTLTIDAYSVSGTPDLNATLEEQNLQFILGLGTVPDDLIFADGLFAGTLVPGGPFLETVFETTTGAQLVISLLLMDNRLDMVIVPGGPGTLGFPDEVAVRRSQLTVHYLAPEPSTMGLLGLGLLKVLWVAGRRRIRH